MPRVTKPSVDRSESGRVHVRYRDPGEFETLRTPDWAEKAADSVVAGSDIRLGKRADADEWIPQEVPVPEPVDAEDARRQADEILQRIEY